MLNVFLGNIFKMIKLMKQYETCWVSSKDLALFVSEIKGRENWPM